MSDAALDDAQEDPAALPRLHPDAKYRLCLTEADLDDLCDELSRARIVGFDTETSGLDVFGPDAGRVVGLCFSTAPHTGWYVPIRHEVADGYLDPRQLPDSLVLDRLGPMLETMNLVGHNAKFDWKMMKAEGWDCHFVDDTFIMASLIGKYGPRERSLKALTRIHFGVSPLEIHEVVAQAEGRKPKKTEIAFHKYDIEQSCAYAAADADWTLQLREVLYERLKGLITDSPHPEHDSLFAYKQIEMPLMPVVARMELAGVPIDTDYLTNAAAICARMISRVENSTRREIWKVVGKEWDININSTQQLQKLFEEDWVDAEGNPLVELPLDPSSGKPKRTNTGRLCLDNSVLLELSKTLPWVQGIITFKALKKLHSTFLTKMPKAAHAGRIHANFWQVGTETGRFSASNPNLQQIPKNQHFFIEMMSDDLWQTHAAANGMPVQDFRDRVTSELLSEGVAKPSDVPTWESPSGAMFSLRRDVTSDGLDYSIWESWVCYTRSAIKAGVGKYIVEADYSQIELRVFAGESKETALIKAFETGEDVHARTASLVFNVPVEQVTKKQRGQAKTVNFGIIYGAGPKRISESEGISISEAQQIVSSYFTGLPTARNWIDSTKRDVVKRQRSVTKYKRVRDFTNLLLFGSNVGERERSMAEREGVNAIIQGTAADIMKIALVRLEKFINQRHADGSQKLAEIVMTVHDSVVLEVDGSVPVESIVTTVLDAMVWDIPGYPPIEVDVQVGPSWGQGVEYQDLESGSTVLVEEEQAVVARWVLHALNQLDVEQVDSLSAFLRSRCASRGGALTILFHREGDEPVRRDLDGPFRLDFRDVTLLRRLIGDCKLYQDPDHLDAGAVFSGFDNDKIFGG